MSYANRVIIVIVLLVTVCIHVALSQKQPVVVQASGKAVFLYWKRQTEKQAFNVYRKLPHSSQTRLNSMPIVPLGHRADIVELLGQDCGTYLQRFGVAYPEQIVDLLVHNKAIEAFACVLDPRIAAIRGSGFVDTAVTTGQTYLYSVAVVKSGGDSMFIKDIEVSAIDHPPLAPIHVEAKGGDGFVDLRWTEPTGPYAGAEVYRSNERDKGFGKLTTVPILLSPVTGRRVPGFRDTQNIVPMKVYWYKLASRDAFGNVSFSAAVSAVPYDSTPPAPPTVSSIMIDPNKRVVTITWQQSDTTDVVGFYVYSSGEIIHYGKRENTIPLQGSVRSYSLPSNPIRKVMWYRVSAVDSYHNESYSQPKPIRLSQ